MIASNTNSAQLILRPMTLEDVDDVVTIDQRCFGASGWSRHYFVGELTESPISIFYVLCDSLVRQEPHAPASEQMIGYFGTWHVVDQLHLCTFAVDPDHQRQGVGRVLLNCVLRLAQRLDCSIIQLEVRKSNQAARALYAARGFVDDGIRRNLYDHPKEDGVLMSLPTPSVLVRASGQRAAARWPSGLQMRWDDRGGVHDEHWPNL